MSKLVPIGTIESLHLHVRKANQSMYQVKTINLIKDVGIKEESNRTFDHRPERIKKGEDPNLRHVSFIHRSELKEHEEMLTVENSDTKVFNVENKYQYGSDVRLVPGSVKSNIEFSSTLSPKEFLSLLGEEIVIGTDGARLLLTIEREPCKQMNKVCKGLEKSMENGRAGFFGRVINSGKISEKDIIYRITFEKS